MRSASSYPPLCCDLVSRRPRHHASPMARREDFATAFERRFIARHGLGQRIVAGGTNVPEVGPSPRSKFSWPTYALVINVALSAPWKCPSLHQQQRLAAGIARATGACLRINRPSPLEGETRARSQISACYRHGNVTFKP
jgi:hypothetical protein